MDRPRRATRGRFDVRVSHNGGTRDIHGAGGGEISPRSVADSPMRSSAELAPLRDPGR